jgi:hypothetical protein
MGASQIFTKEKKPEKNVRKGIRTGTTDDNIKSDKTINHSTNRPVKK